MSVSLSNSRTADTGNRVRLIWAFAVRDLKARFTATALGLLWTLIVPLATVAIYSLVFSVIFRAQAPPMGNGNPGIFALWFFCGLVVWSLFAKSVNGGIGSIVAMGPMMQKVYIPSYVPVVSAVLTTVFESLLEVLVMLALMAAFLNVSWTWLLFPLLLVLLTVFASGLAYCLAVSYVHFRDTGQITAILMQMWFFITPVIYPLDLIPEDVRGIPLRSLIELNPMTGFVQIGRDLVYGLTLPPLDSVLYVIGWTIAAVLAAVLTYRRWGQDVSEDI